MTSTIVLPELVVPGHRLGRHVLHDPLSLDYQLPPAAIMQSVEWERRTPILDQGDVGACTGNALTGALGTGPLYDALLPTFIAQGLALNEAFALKVYSAAETLDGDGPYPPNDNGSSGLSVAKVAKTDGYVSGYQHATSVEAVHTALAAGPVLIGSYWYSGMDTPDTDGVVKPTGTIRGGHEYLMRGYDAARDLFLLDNSWGTSYGKAGSFYYDTPSLTTLLAKTGDATSLVPVNAPAPTPTPPPAPPSDADAADRAFAAAATLCTRHSRAFKTWQAAKGL